MIVYGRPDAARIDAFLASAASSALSYAEVGASRAGAAPPGYDADHRRVLVGVGDAAFGAAVGCLRRWQMFGLGWVELAWPRVEPAEGATVAVIARLFGVTWLNACRVVYAEGPAGGERRYRFAYGTLADHAERGEERFTVEQLGDGTVWYDLFAFSRPRHPLARMGYPLARMMQRRFGRGSLAAFSKAVAAATAGGHPEAR